MKSCPKCNRTYPDEGQKFCTFDGGLLIAPQAFDPNATIRATSVDLTLPSEKATSRELPPPDFNETIAASYAPTTTFPRNTGPTGPTTSELAGKTVATPTPTPPPTTPPPSSELQQTVAIPADQTIANIESAPPIQSPPPVQKVPPAHVQTAPPVQTIPPVQAAAVGAAAKKKSKLPLIIGLVVLFLLLGGGALVGVAVVFRPQLEKLLGRSEPAATPTPIVETNANTSATPEASPVEANTNTNKVPPPANSELFANSKDNLDGKLAEHYFDFYFYYPQTWKRDPKAGVPGASNFVLVERSEQNFPLENFAVGWYTSTGTFIGDLRNYPKRVEEFSSALAKQFPEYRKVSEGPTKINSMQGYEFRWEGLSKGSEKGDVHLWGRVVFLPTGNEGDTTGATLTMFSTSAAPELKSVSDVGEAGEMPIILDSFRFGKQ